MTMYQMQITTQHSMSGSIPLTETMPGFVPTAYVDLWQKRMRLQHEQMGYTVNVDGLTMTAVRGTNCITLRLVEVVKS